MLVSIMGSLSMMKKNDISFPYMMISNSHENLECMDMCAMFFKLSRIGEIEVFCLFWQIGLIFFACV